LRLEAEASVGTVACAIEAGDRHGELEAVVNLQTRLGRPDVEGEIIAGEVYGMREAATVMAAAGEDEVVVGPDLAARGVSAADRAWCAEVMSAACDGYDGARRNEVGVDVGDLVGMDLQGVIEDVGAATEIEIRMMREVHERRRVGECPQFDTQRSIEECVATVRGECAGVAVGAVGGDVDERGGGIVVMNESPGELAEA
jgi:hypothetical protein